ncbi:MAG TPA: Crp/Fnr family transcriptional regulator [Sphingomonas sp.]|nr:Crp/Fnr family transcriptional regulator [Sphingomonas sp.]
MLTDNFLRSRRRRDLSDAEKAVLESAIERVETLPARRTTHERGDEVRYSTLLVSGYMCRYMDARDGYRQLVCYHIPGDFLDLHGYTLQRLDHDLATITEARVAYVPHAKITEITETIPHLGRMLWFSTLLDAALHREWIFRIGRLDAQGRIAHFLCETHARMDAVGLADGGSFALPLTQQDLGEACGLTSVHVNRTLRRLRDAGLATVHDKRAVIHDRAALASLGEFHADYLYLDDHCHTP